MMPQLLPSSLGKYLRKRKWECTILDLDAGTNSQRVVLYIYGIRTTTFARAPTFHRPRNFKQMTSQQLYFPTTLSLHSLDPLSTILLTYRREGFLPAQSKGSVSPRGMFFSPLSQGKCFLPGGRVFPPEDCLQKDLRIL